MDILDDEAFIRGVEGLIKPGEVCDLHFYQKLKKALPRALFREALIRASRKTPRMGFVIEPYSLFLFFRLADIERARSMLPDRYELVPAKFFEDGEPGYYFGTGVFNTRATTFWGARQESYLVARDRETGLPSWIFIDILSNTIMAMPKPGIADANSPGAIHTTNSKGEILVDFKEKGSGRRIAARASLRGARPRKPDEDIWLMGNTSISYAKHLLHRSDEPFAVVFDPAEIEEALELPLDGVEIIENSLFPGLMEEKPCAALCFPYAQHYVADSPGCRTRVRDREDMVRIYNGLGDLSGVKAFSPRLIRNQLLAGGAVMAAALAALHIILLFR